MEPREPRCTNRIRTPQPRRRRFGMRHGIIWVGSALALILAAAPVSATSPVHVDLGPSRDGSLHDLQKKLDHLVGPGRVRAESDYLGARAGDPDPWFWVNNGANAIAITL